MSFHWPSTLSLLLLMACHGSSPDITPDNDPKPFHPLIERANDEKQSLAKRLSAASQAYQLAVHEHDIPRQIESLRAEGPIYWRMDSTDNAILVFRRLAELARSVDDKESLGVAYNNIGLVLSERASYDSAIFYYTQASRQFRDHHDSLRLFQCSINTGIAYKNLGLYEKAFSVTTDAAKTLEAINSSASLATAYTTLGNTLKDLRRMKEALVYHEKALSIRRQLGDSAGVAGSYNNIGNIYKGQRQFPLALQYYLRSLDLKTRLNLQRPRSTTLDNIAETYLGMGKDELAEQYEKQSLQLRNVKEDKDGWMTSADQLAKIYLARHETARADTLARHIAQVADTPMYIKHQLDNALLLQEIATQKKDYAGAAQYGKRASDLKDSLFSSQLSTEISRMNARFRTEEQQRQLELAEKNDLIKAQQIARQRNFIFLMAIIIALLLFLSYQLYISSQLRKKARERTELLMSELNHRVKNNLQIISDILHLQTLTTSDPKERQLIEASRVRIQSIGIVHNLLYQKEYTGRIDMNSFIVEIIRNISQALQHTAEQSRPAIAIDDISLNADLAIPLGLITNELLTNIYKYNQTDQYALSVRVEMRAEEGKYNLLISDNGPAWDMQGARKKKKGLGLLLVGMLTRQLRASWQSYREGRDNIHNISFAKI